MLGEQIAEERLKIVSRRVINVDGGIPKIETSTTGEGNYRGTEFKQTSTFWTIPKSSDGKTLYIEGRGTIITNDGELATYTGQAIGKQDGRGVNSMRFYGSIIYETSSSGKLSSLSDVVAVFETEVDESDNAIAKIWEWK
jgi:hypothetical protein